MIKGKIGPLFYKDCPKLSSSKIWLFPPGYPHGWSGNSRAAEVVVYHFPHVPTAIKEAIPLEGYFSIDLNTHQKRRLQYLAKKSRQHLLKPNNCSALHHEQILLELCLIIMESKSTDSFQADRITTHPTIQKGINWFKSNLQKNPSLTDVSKASGYSVAHFRRIFHQVMGCHPLEILNQIKIQRAKDLLKQTDLILEDIAEASGYGSGSSLSRAFKMSTGTSPQQWKKQNMIY